MPDGPPEARAPADRPDAGRRTCEPTRPAALAGRGAYVCRTEACLDKAINKGALSRALKTPLPADLRDALAGSLTNDPCP